MLRTTIEYYTYREIEYNKSQAMYMYMYSSFPVHAKLKYNYVELATYQISVYTDLDL